MTWSLFMRNLRHHARLLVSMTLGLAAFEVLIVWVAAKIEEGSGLREFLEQLLPPEAQEAVFSQFGLVSFPGAVAFGFMHPVAIVAAAAFVVVAATVPAAERESGFLDLVLARPVPRARYLLAVVLLVIVGSLLLPAALLGGAAVALAIVQVEERLPLARYVPAAAGLVFLLLAVGGYALLFAAGAKRRGAAVGRAVGLTLALYVVEFLADFWKPLDRIRWLSPFHYYKPIAAAIVPSTPIENPAVLLLAFAVLVAAAVLRFRRQDL